MKSCPRTVKMRKGKVPVIPLTSPNPVKDNPYAYPPNNEFGKTAESFGIAIPSNIQTATATKPKVPVTPKKPSPAIAVPKPKAHSGIKMPKYGGIEITKPKEVIKKRSAPSIETAKAKPPSPEIDPKYMVTLPSISHFTSSQIDELYDEESLKSETMKLREMYEGLSKTFLLNKQITVGDAKYQILEIEFYQVPDPYIPVDTSSFKNYLKAGDTRLYIDPENRLYILIGDTWNPIVILIRSIRDNSQVSEKKVIVKTKSNFLETNPSVEVEGVIEGPDNIIPFLLSTHNMNLTTLMSKESRFMIVDGKIGGESTPRLYASPRGGLNLKNETSTLYYGRYLMRPFRFSYFPGDLKIAKHFWAIQARLDEVPDNTFIRDLKLPKESLQRLISTYLKGEKFSIDYFLTSENSSLDNAKIQTQAFGFYRKLAHA